MSRARGSSRAGVALAAFVTFGGAACKGGDHQESPKLDASVALAAAAPPDATPPPAPDAAPGRDAAPEADKPMAPEVPTVVLPEPGDPAEPGDAHATLAEDAQAVTRVVQAARGRINACAEEDDGGRVTMHVTVSATGQLLRVSTEGDAREHLVKCTTRALRAARFPRLGHETTVTVTFDFPVFLR